MFAQRTNWDLRPNPLAAAVARQTRPFTDLTVTNPTAVGLEYPAAAILAAWARPEALRYQPDPRGLAVAREAVSGYYAARGVAIGAERLLLTASTSEAYSHLFRLLCDPGDRVHVPRPSYPLLDLLASICDVELARYPLWYEQAWHLDVAQLERALSPRSRAIVVIHPNNPTGSYCREAEWEALAALAARHSLALIVDEVFFDFAWSGGAALGETPAAQRHLDLDANSAPLVFVLNGLSKICGLPQAKLGWIALAGRDAARRQAASERLELINDTYLSAGAPIQWAAPSLLAARLPIQAEIARRIAGNLARLDERLAAPSASARQVSRMQAEAGWTAVLRLPNLRNDEQWAEYWLDAAGVLVHPGHFYDFDSDAALVLSLLPEPRPFAAALDRAFHAVDLALR